MASRTSLVRVGAAVLGVSTALMIGVLPASAGTSGSSQHSDDAPAATATVVGDDGTGTTVVMDKSQDEGSGTVTTKGVLNKIQIVRNAVPDPKTVDAYCTDLTTGLDRNAIMNATDWSKFIGRPGSTFHQNSAKINWILRNSYPSIDLSTLATNAGLKDTLSERDAISGTQAAIWHFSDGANLETQAQHPDLVTLYNYLIGSANTGVGEGKITISPDKATGTLGKLVGPFTLKTNLTSLALDTANLPSGVTVVDANGKELTTSDLVDGAKFYFKVPADATASSGSVNVSATTPSGMIFVAQHSQEIIATGPTTVVTQAGATWTQGAATTPPTTPAAPGGTKTGQQPGLAYTGVSTTGPIVLGILLVLGGGLFLLVQRRHKRAA